MTEIKVGDRVRHIELNILGTVIDTRGREQRTQWDGKGWAAWDKNADVELITLPTSQGPVRTKTVREIVLGVYGRVRLHRVGNKCVDVDLYGATMTATKLRAAAATLLEIAEALDQ